MKGEGGMGRGSLEKGKKGGKGKKRDKSPAWSSQDLDSTVQQQQLPQLPHSHTFSMLCKH